MADCDGRRSCRSSIFRASARRSGPRRSDARPDLPRQDHQWDDPAIKKLNPNLKLPSTAIVVVHRSDGSGTTFIFTDYLSKVSPDWKSNVGASTVGRMASRHRRQGQRGRRQQRRQTEGRHRLRRVRLRQAEQDDVRQDGQQGRQDRRPTRQPSRPPPPTPTGRTRMLLPHSDQSAGRDSWPITGATFILMYKQPQDPASSAAGAEVLRLGLREGRQAGRGSRLCADAGRGDRANREDLGGNQGPDGKPVYRQITVDAASRSARSSRCAAAAAAFRQRLPARLRSRAMTEIACRRSTEPRPQPQARARALRRFGSSDSFFRLLTLGRGAPRSVLLLGGVIVSLFIGAWPAFRSSASAFSFSEPGARPRRNSARLPPIYGTLVTSLIAMLIAVPVGLGIAVFLTELCPLPCGGRSASRSSSSPGSHPSSTASGACSFSRR